MRKAQQLLIRSLVDGVSIPNLKKEFKEYTEAQLYRILKSERDRFLEEHGDEVRKLILS